MNIDNLETGTRVRVTLNPEFDHAGLVNLRVGLSNSRPPMKVLYPADGDASALGYNYFTADSIASLSLHEDQPGPKYDGGKPDWTLLPMFAVEEVVKVMDFGAKKYERESWGRVPDAKRRYLAAAYRHMFQYFWKREMTDDESNLHHLAHAVCCLLFVTSIDINGQEVVPYADPLIRP
jgi:hypothetical protein